MGREQVIKKIKSRAMKAIVLCGIMVVLLGAFALVLFVGEVPEGAIVIGGLAVLMLLLQLLCLHRYVKPASERCFKKNPRLLEQADELFSNIVYQDNFIICSERLIANAKDITQIGRLDEITDICENVYTYYGVIKTGRILTLTLPNYKIEINVYGKKREVVDKLKYNIVQHCPKVLDKQFKFGARIE